VPVTTPVIAKIQQSTMTNEMPYTKQAQMLIIILT